MLKLNVIFPVMVATALALLSTVPFLPGMMSFDSVVQYTEAIGASPLTNVHSPLITHLWHALMRLWPNPGVLLVFHHAIYWGAILLFALAVAETALTRSILIAAIGLWPPLFVLSMHLWTDSGMMSGLALAIAALAMHSKQGRVGWLVLATLALFYATAARDNAITGVAPLLALVAWRASRSVSARQPARIAATLALTVLLLAVFAGGLKLAERNTVKTPMLGTIFVWDMAAVSIDRHKDLIPDYMSKAQVPDFVGRLAENFNPNVNVPTFFSVGAYPPSGKEGTLVRDWLRVAESNPGPYLRHRAHVFSTLLSLRGDVYYPYEGDITPNKFAIAFAFPRFMTAWGLPSFAFAAKLPIYRVWPYFALAWLIIATRAYLALVHGSRTKFGLLTVMTAVSGLFVEAPLFVFAPSADYRYSIWMVFSGVLATALFGAELGEVLSLRLKRA
jgi:hypothetical protein